MRRRFLTVIILFLSILIVGCSGSSSNCNQTYGAFTPAPTPTPTPVQQKQRVVVRVVYPDGTPITGVQIFSDNPNVVIHNAVTDANGYYTFEISVPQGEHFNLTFVKDHFVIASVPGVIDGSGTPLEDGVTTLYNFQTVGYLPFSRDVNYHVTSVFPAPGKFCTYCNGIVAIPPSATPKANTEPLPYLGNGFYLLNNTVGGQAIGKMDNCGNWTLFAGKPNTNGAEDGIGENARFQYLNSATISSDGAWLYVTDNDRIRKINTATREVTTVHIFTLNYIQALTISSDDKFLYTATSSSGIAKIDTSLGTVSYLSGTTSLSGYNYNQTDMKFSPDNKYLYIYTVGTIYRYDIDTQVVSTVISGLTASDPVTGYSPAYGSARTMLVSEDGNTLYLNHGSSLASVDVSTGALAHLAGDPYISGTVKSDGYAPDLLLNYPQGITMTRSGTIIILGGGLHYVYSYDIDTKQITTLMGGNIGLHGFYEGTIGFAKFGNVNDISMTSDSKKVFLASYEQSTDFNYVYSIIQYDVASGVTTNFMSQVELDAASGLSPMQLGKIVVSPDNKYIYIYESSMGSILKLEIATKTISSIVTSGVYTSQMVVSPDGKYLYINLGSTIKRIELQTALVDTIYSPSSAYIYSIAISPDGSALYVCLYDNTLSKYIVRKIDTSDLSVSLVSDGSSAGSDPVANISYAQAMAVSSDGAFLYLPSGYKVIGIDIFSGDTFMVANPLDEEGNRDGSGDIATFSSINNMIMPNDGRYILINDYSALRMIIAVP